MDVYHVHICAAWSSEAGDLLWEWTREQVLLAKVTVDAHTKPRSQAPPLRNANMYMWGEPGIFSYVTKLKQDHSF